MEPEAGIICSECGWLIKTEWPGEAGRFEWQRQANDQAIAHDLHGTCRLLLADPYIVAIKHEVKRLAEAGDSRG